MKNRVWAFAIPAVILLAVFLVPSLLTSQSTVMDKPSKEDVAHKMQNIQIPFVANNGQVDEQVRFYAKTFGGTVFVTKDGEIVYSLPGNSSDVETQCLASLMHSPKGIRDEVGMLHDYHVSDIMHPASWIVDHDKSEFQNPKSTSSDSKNLKSSNPKSAIQNLKSGVAIKETLVGGRVQEITGNEKAVTKVSYFKGNDPSQWKTNISTYDVVSLGEVYDGIELKLKAYGNNVEKLFCVKSGANPEQIKISLSGIQPSGNPPPLSPSVRGKGGCLPLAGAGGGFVGARGLWVNEHGELVAETELGPVKFTKPIAYQEIDGKRVDVAVEYSLSNPKSEIPNPKSEYGFRVASYDKSHDLIIDPLLASTFLGGSGEDIGYSLTLDTSGNVYVTGRTSSTDFPTTSGAYDTSFNGGSYDGFVSKLDGGLTSLLASTYLGGSSDDYGMSLALDTNGNVYVTGSTSSTDFPTTSGAYNTSNGGSHDVFVSKLSSGLTSLLASTYLVGSGIDYGWSLALDTSGNVYVTGHTYSTDFPTTSGAYDTSQNGDADAFVSKLDGGLTSLLASTFLGGSGRDAGRSLTLDTSGNIYVTGYTQSTDFPTTSGAYDTSFNESDVFVSKLDGGLSSLLASTYLGGSGADFGNSLTLDTNGNVYVTGSTSSTDFPTTSGAYNTSNGGAFDVFVSKLSSGLTSLLASTYLGGSGIDYGQSITLYTSGNVYVTGYHSSAGFPTTSGAYDTSFNGSLDVFVLKLDGGLTSLLASTYLGGLNGDTGSSIALDTSGNVYVTGPTSSTDFPTTSGAYDTSYGGSGDVFISRLDSNLSASTVTPTPTPSPTPTQECVQPPSNMVAWWPLDETQGPTAYDIAGSFNNAGTWTNSPGTVTGKVAGALSFNGSSYVQVSPQTELDFGTGDFSIDVWVQTVGSQSTRTLVDKRTGTSSSLTGYTLYLYNGKPGLQLAVGSSSTNYNSTATSTAFVADGTWHHIAVTVDRDYTVGLNIYVDGTSTATFNPTGHMGSLTNNAPLVFGGKNLITPSFTFVGRLDEMELFNRALTQQEIQDIYNAGSAGKCKPTPTPANSAPVANAGTDQSVYVGNTVTLDGSGSSDADGDALTYSWAFTTKPGSSTATLSDAAAVKPTFTVDTTGTYVVSLTVNDGTINSSPDTVTISTINVAPVANAGADQSVYVGNTVTLDGSGSSDVDGDLLTYSWAFTTKPGSSTATLSGTTTVNPTFTVDKAGTYVVSLTVNDGTINSNPDTVTISTINVAPVANAGADQSVYVGNTVTLDGSGSSDVDGNLLTYSWAFTTKPDGSTATLSGTTTVNPTFTVDKAGTYVASLTVNDGTINSSPDTVTISTINVAPVANAGADQSVYVGNTVTLDGSGSSDVDGDLLTYSWAFTTKPDGSTATLSDAAAVKPTFTVDKAGTYVVSLTVNDGTINSSPDTVTISTINVAPVANAGNDQTVPEESTVTLDGTGSSDADGNALTYSWAFTTKPTESTATLSGTTTVNPTFTADEEGTYVVSLIVNDGTVNSSPDTVIVTVTDDDDDETPEVIEAEVEIKPETINLKSKGKFKAFIELPSPYKEDNIVTSTVVCEGAHAIDGRIDSSSGGRYVATFNTQDLEVITNSKREEKVFTVTGELMDGTKFEGSDTVKVKGKEKDK